MSGQGGMVTLEIEKWDELRDRMGTLTRTKDELEAKLREALSTGAGDGALEKVLEAFRASLEVCRFAVANLDPETIRGWPHERLTALAASLEKLPVSTPDEKELGITFRVFAREAKDIEHERKLGIHKERQSVPRGAITPAQHEGQVLDDEGKPIPFAPASPEAAQSVAKSLSAAADMARRFGAAPMADAFDAQAKQQADESTVRSKTAAGAIETSATRESSSRITWAIVVVLLLIVLASGWISWKEVEHDRQPATTEHKS